MSFLRDLFVAQPTKANAFGDPLRNNIRDSKKHLMTLANAGLDLMKVEHMLRTPNPQIVESSFRELCSEGIYASYKQLQPIGEWLLSTALPVNNYLNVVSNLGSASIKVGNDQELYFSEAEPKPSMLRHNVAELFCAMPPGGTWRVGSVDFSNLCMWWIVVNHHTTFYASHMTNQRDVQKFIACMQDSTLRLDQLAVERLTLLGLIAKYDNVSPENLKHDS